MPRIKSIDILRGITLIAMVIVNNPGSWSHVYPFLLESDWQGLNFADLIFPTFVFTVGLSIPFALSKAKITLKQDWKIIFRKIFKRTILLFILGILIHLLADILSRGHLRIPGVLQRIAIVYCLCAFSYLFFDKIIYYILLAFAAICFYWLMMTHISIGYVINLNDPSANLGAFLDRLILGKYIYSTNGIYHGFDPESLLGSISAYYNGMFGLIFGCLLQRYFNKPVKLTYQLTGVALLSLIPGIYIAKIIPIIKILWTPSFSMISVGISGLIFILIYWVFDQLSKLRLKLLEDNIIPLGQNSILAYGLEEFLLGAVFMLIPIFNGNSLEIILFKLFANYLSLNAASLACAILGLILIVGLMRIAYKKQIFIKV